MRSAKEPFGGIERAIADMGDPAIVWFRGHVDGHQLLPSLYRFSEERLNMSHAEAVSDHTTPAAAYRSYRPTRLLAWTEQLPVALFCALVRESGHPTVFVLDPIALNKLSRIEGIATPNSHLPCSSDFFLRSELLLEHPIAIHDRTPRTEASLVEEVFTLHGRNRLSLDQQCPDCVRKVVLTEDEKLIAENRVLFRHPLR
jgi:hypothetical protein